MAKTNERKEVRRMQWNLKDISVVRKVADEMWEFGGEVILPDWEWDSDRQLGERQTAVRDAAEAIRGGGLVSERALGALIHYIIDMVEP